MSRGRGRGRGVPSTAPLGSDVIARWSPGRPPRLCPCLGNGKSHQRSERSHSTVGQEGRKDQEGRKGSGCVAPAGSRDGSIAELNISHVKIHWRRRREKGTEVAEQENLQPPRV